MPVNTPKVQLLTYGCQMNEYDSELVAAILTRNGYVLVGDGESPDIILLNTCAVRETANTRVYARVSQLLGEKRERSDLTVGILGCIPQNLKGELLNKFPGVDFVCGPDSYRSLPDLIQKARESGQRGAALDLSEYETYSDIAPARVEGVNAWIAITMPGLPSCAGAIISARSASCLTSAAGSAHAPRKVSSPKPGNWRKADTNK